MNRLKRYKNVKYLMLVFFILIIGLMNHYSNDFYNKKVSYDEYIPMDGASEIDSDGANTHLWCPDPIEKSTLRTETFPLEKGVYEFDIKYESSSDENVMVVMSEGSSKNLQDKGIVIASVPLNCENDMQTVEVDVNRAYQDISVHFECQKDSELRVGKMVIKSKLPIFQDSIVISLMICIGLYIGLVLYHRKMKKEIDSFNTYILLGLTAIVAILPYLNDFLIKGQDITFHLAHIEGIYRGIISGEFPVRINSNQAYEYGYAMPIMYPDLFLYIPAIFRMLGVSLLNSYKLFIFFINIGTIFSSYFCCKKILKSNNAGLFGSIIYTLSAFRLINIYERAALGEVLAMVFLPLILLGMYEIIDGNRNNWFILSLGFTCLLQSHVVTTLITGLFCVLCVLSCIPKLIKEKERIISLFLAAVMSVLPALWSLIPMLSYMRLPLNVYNETASLHSSGLYILQVFSTLWGEGIRGNVDLGKTQGEMPLTLGIVFLIGIVSFIFGYYKEQEKEENKIAMYFLKIGLISLFMSMWLFPWDILQKISVVNFFLSKIQYSFRFLTISTLFLTIPTVAGIIFLINEATERKIFIMGLGMIVLSIVFLNGTLEKETFSNKSEVVEISETDDLYLYKESDKNVWKENGEIGNIVSNGKLSIFDYNRHGSKCEFCCDIREHQEEGYIDMPLAYYPDYVAYEGKEKLVTNLGENGCLRVQLPTESGKVIVYFREKPMWVIADIISIVSWFMLCCFAGRKIRKGL